MKLTFLLGTYQISSSRDNLFNHTSFIILLEITKKINSVVKDKVYNIVFKILTYSRKVYSITIYCSICSLHLRNVYCFIQ